jgi:hypothetical protein
MTTTRKRPSKRRPTFSLANLLETNAAPIMMDLQFITPNQSDWARFCHVDTTTIYRWHTKGIPEKEADRIAIKCLGIHPSLIWPEWFDTAPR